MNRVGVPLTSPVAIPLSTSRRTPQDVRAASVMLEECDVQLELGAVGPQVVVIECILATEEQLVHGPESILVCSCKRHQPGYAATAGKRPWTTKPQR